MKLAVIILARMDSQRLPGKALMQIQNKTILEFIIERLLKVIKKNQLIIATSNEESDDILETFCKIHGFQCFRGSKKNVSQRFLECANQFQLDFAVRINGDNVLVDTKILSEMIHLIDERYDYISNVKGRTFPRGMSIEIVKIKSYSNLYSNFKSESDFEHVTSYLYNHENDISTLFITNERLPEAANIQLSLDTFYDFQMISKIIQQFKADHTNYNIEEIFRIYQQVQPEMTFIGETGPLLIAEIGGNHEGDFDYAIHLTNEAIASGADFIKFQIYSGDTLVNKKIDPNRNTHFKKFQLSKQQYIQLAEMVENAGKKFMASIWDSEMIDWVKQFITIYKIGSGDLTAWPLIERITEEKKPIILSTGLATEKDVIDTVAFIQSRNNMYKSPDNLALLQCTSMYPIPYNDANLQVMRRLKEITNCTVGYSDHTIGSEALIQSVHMGAQVLEFHFTDTRDQKTFRDHKVSLTKTEVLELKQRIIKSHILSGNSVKQPTFSELENNHSYSFRRSVYLNRDIKKGEIIKKEDLVILRPEAGLSARYYYELIGKTANNDIKQFEIINWEQFS